MKIQLLLLATIISFTAVTTASAESNYRQGDRHNQKYDRVDHRDHDRAQRYSTQFYFGLGFPIHPYNHYRGHHSYQHYNDYRGHHSYRGHHKKRHHHEKRHHRHHHDNRGHQKYRGHH